MSKKMIVLCLVLALALAVVAPASAGKKRKKKPKPYESPVETVAVAHPVFNSASGTVVGVTAQEFLQNCSEPSTNGLDAFVFEVPKPYTKRISDIQSTGSSLADEHDLDIYLFDADCEPLLQFNTETQDESGVLPKGTAWVLLHNYVGGPVDVQFTLTPR